MPILITCPSCSKTFRAKDDAIGKSGACPHCRKGVALQGPHVSAFDVFISYSAKDKAIADAVVATLETSGLRCWIAPRDIVAGKTWSEAILDGLQQSRVMVLVFSANSNTSQQVLREVERAVHHQMPIVPFRIENLMPSRAMEYFISTHHWLDAYNPPLDAHLDKLATTCASLLTGQQAESAPAKQDAGAMIRSAVKTLAARDYRTRVVMGAAALFLLAVVLITGGIVASMYGLRDPKASAEVIKAKADAEGAASEVRKLERGPGIDAMLQDLDNSLRAGQASFDQKDFRAALSSFIQASETADLLRQADTERQQAKPAQEDAKAARDSAEMMHAQQFAIADWNAALDRESDGKKHWDKAAYAEAAKAFREAAARFRRAAASAGQNGRAHAQALAYFVGYGTQLQELTFSAKEIYSTAKEEDGPEALLLFMESAKKDLSNIRAWCRENLKLKDDPVKKFFDERDADKRSEMANSTIPIALRGVYGMEAANCYWVGHDLANARWLGQCPRFTRGDFRKQGFNVRFIYVYSAGCPDAVVEKLRMAQRQIADALQIDPASWEVVWSKGERETMKPLRERYFLDLPTASATFALPKAVPSLPMEQQQALRELHKLGANIQYAGEPLAPVGLYFGAGIAGRVTPHARRLPTLRSAALFDPDLDDSEITELVGAWPDLAALSLKHTRISDAGLAHVGKMTGLRVLDLTGLDISDRGLAHLKALTNLTGLDVADTKVSSEGMAALKKALPKLQISKQATGK